MAKNIITPHAAMITWNYVDRIDGNNGTLNPNDTEPLIINTYSLISVQTQKTKSNTAGSFAVTLAPSKNWINTLTAGSWCCIMMSRSKIEGRHLEKADTRMVKFFGRIESTRVEVSIDPITAARKTTYVVTGTSWGSTFNANFYVEPSLRVFQKDGGAFGVRKTLGITDVFTSLVTKDSFPGTSALLLDLLSVWTKSDISVFRDQNPGVVIKPDSAWVLPDKVKEFFGFDSSELGKIISDHRRFGVLNGVDTYDDSVIESIGVLDPQSVFGIHSLWQVLVAHSNTILNEMFCDMHVNNGKFQLSLYKRIRPFVIRDEFDGKDELQELSAGKSIVSNFKDIKVKELPIDEIVNIECGTNWRDKFNFVEVNASHGLGTPWLDVSSSTKASSQIFDEDAFKREGLKAIIEKTKFYPPNGTGGPSIISTTVWKYLLKAWYFDTHRMLNGSISFIGQDEYIEVGQNIRFGSELIAPSNNWNTANTNNPLTAKYFTAHVESISHNFSVDATTGARHFITTVQFVRGVLTDVNSKPIQTVSLGVNDVEGNSAFTGPSLIDVDATDLGPSKDKNKRNVFGTSTPNDPDPQKVKGK